MYSEYALNLTDGEKQKTKTHTHTQFYCTKKLVLRLIHRCNMTQIHQNRIFLSSVYNVLQPKEELLNRKETTNKSQEPYD